MTGTIYNQRIKQLRDYNIVIQYPPDYDGELHIKAVKGATDVQFTFTHATVNDNTWETLVAAAKGIIAQDERIKASDRPSNA